MSKNIFEIFKPLTTTCTFNLEGLARFNRARHIVNARWSN